MKRNVLYYFGFSFLLVLLGLLPASMAQAQNLCVFDPNIKKGPPPPPPAQAAPPYFVWKAGGRGDQSTVKGQHSGLVGWTSDIDDQTFAEQTQMAILNGGNDYLSVPLVYVFGECFGGGMIDDLAGNITNPMSIVAAAFFNQRASYPTGNGSDFIWAYINALPAETKAQPLAAQAATDDPYGWAPKPNPARKGEKQGKETPEYYSQAGGDKISVKRDANEVNSVILWAGQPEKEDDKQLSKLILKLLALGYSKDNIVVFFGAGWYSDELSEVSKVMQEKKFDATHLRPANPADLLNVLKVWAFPPGKIQPPKFLFFLAADHGCNNAFMEEEKDGNGEDGMHGGGPVPTGGIDPWGNGPGSLEPQPPRY